MAAFTKDSTGTTHKAASANEVSAFAASIGGENNEADSPNMALFGLITMIRKAESAAADDWTPTVERELKYLKSAVHLIENNNLLAFRYGGDMKGALELVSILKQRAATADLELQLAPAMPGLMAQSKVNHFKDVSAFKTSADKLETARLAKVAARGRA